MPFISRQALAELQARADRLRDRAEQAEAAVLVQARANGRIALTTGDTEARLREELQLVRADRDGLRRQLDHALGNDDTAQVAIDAGARKTA